MSDRKLFSVILCFGFIGLAMYTTFHLPTYMNDYVINRWYKKENMTNEILLREGIRTKSEVEKHPKTENKIIDIFATANKHLDEKTIKLKQIHDYIYKTLDRLQNEGDCERKKIIRCSNSVLSGLGSTIHRHVICLHIAFALDRIFFIDQPEYIRFNGLAAFTKLESGKCAYLKKNLTNIQNKCDFKYLHCYDDKGGFEINNTYKLLEFTREADFPAPKYIPRTLPLEMNKVLKKLGIKTPWHWFTAQLLGYLLMRPNDMFAEKFAKEVEQTGLHRPLVGLHFRHGDKLHSEAHYIYEKNFTDVAKQIFNKRFNFTKERYIYLASDDFRTLNITRKLLNSSYVIKSSLLFNNRRDDASKETMEGIMMDLYFLVHCDYSIVTFSSNIGRLVWELRTSQFPYHGADEKIISMDFKLFYGWYDYWSTMPYYLTIHDKNKSSVFGHEVIIPYKKGQLAITSYAKTLVASNGSKINVIFGYLRHSKPQVRGYFIESDLVAWPGAPTYKNDVPG